MRFSVVIPTFERRDVVTRNVVALEEQSFRDFEVIVAVDGSTDGTADALRGLDTTFPLQVIECGNNGAATGRNGGARAARGEVLLFLDDDMKADPLLLEEHDRSHRAGADLVVGDLPLDPESPANLLSWGVGLWAAARAERLSRPGAELSSGDLLTGQLSIARETFERLGGFDEHFTRHGSFGGEDVDFGLRAIAAGCRPVFNPRAISYQYYDVDPGTYLRRAFEAGRAEQELSLKHADHPKGVAGDRRLGTRRSRLLLGPFVWLPEVCSAPLRASSAALVRSGVRGKLLRRLFWGVRTVEHLRGARAARRSRS